MGSSMGNSNQWQPYGGYKDCSLEICSIYCPQWCYIIFPPPPAYGYGDSAATDFSPLIIAIIGILASAFILVSYYTIISKYCTNRATAMDMDAEENLSQASSSPPPPAAGGLDEALIKCITVCTYKREDGLVEGTDCSVCLSEFEENESLRLLPKCSHAFHLPCIDTWLKSHSTCPLCRSNISPPTQHSAFQYQHTTNDTLVVIVVQDLQDSTLNQQTPVLGLRNHDHHDVHPFRRSVSLNSLSCQAQVSVADILRDSQDSEENEFRMGIESSKELVQQISHSNYNTEVSNLGLNRSISTGKLGSTNYGKGKSCIIPS